MDLPPQFSIYAWGLFGLMVGSFLNVAIHRLPLEGESVSVPKRSRCPACRRELPWQENLPLISWVLLRGKCRGCRWPIPVRYPLVELFTAGLWGLAAWLAPEGAWDLTLVHVVVLSGLVVATFVDFDCFEIPDEISIGGMILAPVAAFLVPALHDQTWLARELSGALESGALGSVDRVGALIGSLAGVLVGGGVLFGIGWIGSRIFGRDAMGFGDVKLLAAGGGFLGPGGALAALLLAALAASVAGLLNVLRFFLLTRSRARQRGARQSLLKAARVARIAGRYLPFGPYLGIGIGIALLDWNHVIELWRVLTT